MIMGPDFSDIAHAGVLAYKLNSLVEEAKMVSWLRTSMEPQASPGVPAELDVVAQAVRSVSTRPPQLTLRINSSCQRVLFTWYLVRSD